MTAVERGSRGGRDRALIAASALALGVGATPVAGQYTSVPSIGTPSAGPQGAYTPLRFIPTLSGELTYTNNVDLLPSDQRRSDFVLQLTPGFAVEYESPRVVLRGSVALPILLYARTGSDNNEVAPLANLYGRAEVVDNFFFVEAQAYVQQTYLTPFGARPDSLTNATDNRYTSATYRVTPYIEGDIGGTMHYIVRDDNIWTNLESSPIDDRSVYTNHLTGTIDRAPSPWGWGADVQRTVYDFSDQERKQVLELARLRGVWRPDPQWQGFISGGYERNKFPLSETDGAIYGLGFTWRPTERTTLDVGWEHRFFGGSYRFLFDHRTPRTAWTVRASRNITSYPEQIANVPAGSFLPFVLNAVLTSRIPDPAERLRFIQNYINERGLPLVLSEPLAIYSQQIYLQELASGSVGLLGVRNSVVFSVFRSKYEAIAGSGATLPPVIGGANNNTQIGGTAVWAYQLTPTSTLTVTGSYNTTEANEPFSAKADEYALRVAVTRPISPNTSAFAGARYQRLDSDLANSYREAAVFVGFHHLFR